MVYYQIRSDVMFRNYKEFGYLTDNRNYSYKKYSSNLKIVGDKIVSETGAIFLSILSQKPQQMNEIVKKIMEQIPDVEYDILYSDVIEFYDKLDNEGFLVSGNSLVDCSRKDKLEYEDRSSIQEKLDTIGVALNNPIETQDYFDNFFNGRPQLRSIHIEITSICNERCIHCYIPHHLKNHHMNIDLFNKIVDESKEMNLLNLTLTGGEPMLHPKFIEMIKRCKAQNISINVLSNLTVLSEEIVNELKGYPLASIQASLYSIDPSIHDAITKMKGSCNLTKEAIKKLVDNNVNIQISCPILKNNMNCYSDVIEWAKTLNLNVSSDYELIGKYNSDTSNLDCRLTYDEIYRILQKDKYFNIGNLIKEVDEKKSLTVEDNICSVCRYSLCISENGNVYPCAGWQSNVLGNICNYKLKQIWNESEKVKNLRSIKIKDINKCANCDDRIYCSICMVRNANEDSLGDPMKVCIYQCEIARLKKELYNEQKIVLTSIQT